MTRNSSKAQVVHNTGDSWTLLKLLDWTTEFFTGKGIENPRLDAQLLLGHVLRLDRVELYLNFDRPLATEELDTIRPLIKRRGQREPLQYLIGTTEFWSLEFEVTPAVLIPRADTEILIEEALSRAGEQGSLLDVGTGSGVIAVSLATELPNWKITALDVSPEALIVATRNAANHGVSDRVEMVQGDLVRLPEARYDLIVSNPPYIAHDEWEKLMPEVRNFEPQSALLAEAGGLDCYQKLVTQAASRLKPDGWLLVEIGYTQREAVQDLFVAAGLSEVFVRHDYAGQPRVVGGCLQ